MATTNTEPGPDEGIADIMKQTSGLHIDDLGLDLEHEEAIPTEPEWDDIEVHVSDSQYEVIKRPFEMNEILSVRAGPGLGKTFTLMARIARLLGGELQPHEILVLSMANRSVSALQKHLEHLVGPEIAENVEISTFHSFCGSVVDQYAQTINPETPRRRLLDLTGWRNIAEFFLSKHVMLNGHTIGTNISVAKFEKLLNDIADGNMTTKQAQEKFKVLSHYLDGIFDYMEKHGMMRYNDLVGVALDVIEQSLKLGTQEALLPRIASYKMVVVDEFQDMYPLLLSVVKAVTDYPTYNFEWTMNKNLIIAGDQNQSIYEFLGSSPKSMDLLCSQLPQMKNVEMSLNDSFRCTQDILDTSVGVCFNRDNDGDEGLRSQKDLTLSSKPVLLSSNMKGDHNAMADEIVRLICCLGGLIRPRDIAILTKSNAEAVKIQLLLRKEYGIECTKISLGNTWIQSRIRLFRDILSVVSGESDASFCLLNILKILDTSQGAKQRASKLFSQAIASEKSFEHTFFEDFIFENLSNGKNFNNLFAKLYNSLKNIAAFMNQVQEERLIFHAITEENLIHSPNAVVQCLHRFSLLNGIKEYVGGPDKLPAREVLTSFNDSLHYCFETYMSHKDFQDRSFIEYFLQNYDQEIPPRNEDLVQVLTIHSAKGLEFPVVFILGGFGNTWQSLLRGYGEEGNSHSRLLYVACTRARDLLYLSTPVDVEEIGETARRLFTTNLPQLDDSSQTLATGIHNLHIKPGSLFDRRASILSGLLRDLKRPPPSSDKLNRGREYYKMFTQQRLYHFVCYQNLPLKKFTESTRSILRKIKH